MGDDCYQFTDTDCLHSAVAEEYSPRAEIWGVLSKELLKTEWGIQSCIQQLYSHSLFKRPELRSAYYTTYEHTCLKAIGVNIREVVLTCSILCQEIHPESQQTKSRFCD